MDSDLRSDLEGVINGTQSEAPSAVDTGAGGPTAAEPGVLAEGTGQGAARPGEAAEGAGQDVGETSVQQRARDATGKFTKAAAQAKAQAAQVETKTKAASAAPSPTDVPPPAVGGDSSPTPPPAQAIKAPAGWTPAEREHFAKAPPELQRAIERREKEQGYLVAKSSAAMKHHEQYTSVMGPYENHFRAQGVDAMQQAAGALQAIVRLQMGSPHERAKILADIYRAYPPDLPAYAALVDGAEPPQQGQQAQAVDPRAIAAQVRQQIEQEWQQKAQARSQQEGYAAVREFEATEPEHFERLKPRMAMLMAAAAQQEKPMTLKEAYDEASWLDPDIRAARIAQERTKANQSTQATLQKSLAAAGSVKNQPAGPSKNGVSTDSVRGTIEGILASSVR